MKTTFIALLSGLFLLASCATKPQPTPIHHYPPPTPPPVPGAGGNAVPQVAITPHDPLQFIRSQIPPPPNTNQWIVLTFPKVSSNFTVLQRSVLLPGVSWTVATNAPTNSVSFLLDKKVTSRFYTTLANAGPVATVTLAWTPSPDPSAIGCNTYYGIASRTYTNKANAGNVTNTTVSGLKAGVKYYFAVTAYNSIGMESVYSGEAAYTIPTNSWPVTTSIAIFPIPPTVAALAATNVTATNAVAVGKVISTGGDPPITMFFYGTADPFTNTNAYWQSIAVDGVATNMVSMTLTNLVPNMTYYYVFAAVNASGLVQSSPSMSFKTKSSLLRPALTSPKGRSAPPAGKSMRKASRPKPVLSAPVVSPQTKANLTAAPESPSDLFLDTGKMSTTEFLLWLKNIKGQPGL